MEDLPKAAAYLLYSVSPAHLCQAAFALASSAVLAVAVTPSRERKLLVNYGARSHGGSTADATSTAAAQRDDDILLRSVRRLTSVGQVQHMWFFTFYATYILCAVFWASQYLFNGPMLRSLAARQVELGPAQTTDGHVAVAWCLMLLQAARRLYESWAFAKPSKSTMWIVHWLLGQLFYVGISVAIWIEGSGAILQHRIRLANMHLTGDALFKLAIAVPLFFFAWVSQYRCHKHLSGLKKYSLPDQGMFRHLISPHYTCECLIYFSLAIVAAPEGHLCNQTLLSALFFVAVNLGVTARGTKSWYIDKFGSDKVAPKKIMIPFLY
ncbi:3-oxo-5-alpha-steroid 4-dehydrogenase [Diaporthe australafricana]|uniref:Polyprenal reductase n=1 Tax=Diaporthe australafricana TaxID=127596 RepID=A0ABR3W6X8_9PEZI